jgi:hypothetical protein
MLSNRVTKNWLQSEIKGWLHFDSFLNELKLKILSHLKYTKISLVNDKIIINKKCSDIWKGSDLTVDTVKMAVWKSCKQVSHTLKLQTKFFLLQPKLMQRLVDKKKCIIMTQT